MRILFDTSIIVEIDRQNKEIVNFLKFLSEKGEELVISTVTVSEILTGSYLRKDSKEAAIKAKEILNQFIWKEIDGKTAEISAKLFSYLIVEKMIESIEYPDVLIAASSLSTNSDYLITLNKKDFGLFPSLKDKIYTPTEFKEQKLKVTKENNN